MAVAVVLVFCAASALANAGPLLVADGADALPAFEVASVKLVRNFGSSAVVQAKMVDRIQDRSTVGWVPTNGARVVIQNWSLLNLIAAAYRKPMRDIAGPSFLSELRFDIEAKIGSVLSAAHVNEMLQSLLAERFQLRVHYEETDVPGYTLVVARSGARLEIASPPGPARQEAGRDGDRAAAVSRESGDEVERLRAFAQQGGRRTRRQMKNIPAGRIAETVAQLLGRPVIDRTGLTGRYDIVLDVPEPEDGDELMEHRVMRALAPFGLKLEASRAPAKRLVVDSVLKVPTPN